MSIDLTEDEKKLAAKNADAQLLASLTQNMSQKELAPTGNHVNDIIAAKKNTGAGAVAGTAANRAAQGASVGGPIGAAIGGGVGLVEGIVKSGAAKRAAKVAEKRSLADIEEKKQAGIGSNINNLIN